VTSHERAGLAFFTFNFLDRVDGLLSAVSSRCGGVSAKPFDSLNLGFRVADDPALVLENRRRFAGAVGFPLESVVATRQVHGAAVRVVGAKDRGLGATSPPGEAWACDGLVTRDRDVFLTGFSADCPLVLLADAESGVIGLAHCGWRSTVAGGRRRAPATSSADGGWNGCSRKRASARSAT
jgi:copper oxidase (laccase) domain-containing protein